MCYNLAVRETLASKSNYTAEWLIASFRTYLVTSEVTTIVSLQGDKMDFLTLWRYGKSPMCLCDAFV